MRSPTILLLLLLVAHAPAQNLLLNPGFEAGVSGWSTFGNAYHEASNPPQFQPHSGSGMVSLFGNFWGTFNTSGIFQSFPASPGDVFELDGWARHYSGDALVGNGAPNDNWMILKIAFLDAGQTEIGAAETTILDGTYATNTWHGASAIQATAPANTTSVQALVIFLQPSFASGAGHVDDLEFRDLQSPPPHPTPGGGVPGVGTPTRITANGQFEIREVRKDGSLGPWTPFEIKGIDVGWTPAGYFPWTTPVPMLADPAFHSVLDKLKDAGVNTLRLYYLPGSATGPFATQTRATLDLCYQLGLKVLWAQDQSTINTAQGNNELTTAVQAYGDHPATLGFAIGNEWNLNLGHSGSVGRASDVQAQALFLKSIDPNRAVISSLACFPNNDLFDPQAGGTTTAGQIVSVASAVELWGMNLYRASTFHPFFHLWPSATNNAPYAIFEWGCDSWDQNAGTVAYSTQAQETAWHMDETWRVTAGPSRQPGYAGTVVFAAVDEWWKNPFGNNSTSVQEPTGFYTTVTLAPPSNPALSLNFRADVDGHRSEEYFGIMELPGLVNKPVYQTVADRFNSRTTPRPDVDITLISAGFLGNAGGLDNGYWALRVNGSDAYREEGGQFSRGLNIVTFDTSTGSITQQARFDTYLSIQTGASAINDAANYVNNLPAGALVGMMVSDTMMHWNGATAPFAPLFSAIQARTGSAHINSVAFRDGWALLGYVDAAAPLAEGAPAGNAQVMASATVVLDLDGDGVGDDVDLDLDGDGRDDAWETARGTDPVRPNGQLLTLDMTLDGSRRLDIVVLPGDASGTFLDIDFASLKLEVATPFQLDVTNLLYTDFALTVGPAGGISLLSNPSVPVIPNGRLILRFLDTSGRLYCARVSMN